MKNLKGLKFIIFVGLLVIMFFNVSPAKAQDIECEKVVIGDRFTLKEGETLSANLCALGGIIHLMPESKIVGNVYLAGTTTSTSGIASKGADPPPILL